ncbi:unnamed protein product [Ambrosiozyma monospora]|uniref:Unnamed protein product n=1 Tax=Ambrosiozyma monospora TaxID=43982 RepID=A0A9W6SUY3_AMBMO|nr:unnamed protein product [Ambrosiozyma monospora]
MLKCGGDEKLLKIKYDFHTEIFYRGLFAKTIQIKNPAMYVNPGISVKFSLYCFLKSTKKLKSFNVAYDELMSTRYKGEEPWEFQQLLQQKITILENSAKFEGRDSVYNERSLFRAITTHDVPPFLRPYVASLGTCSTLAQFTSLLEDAYERRENIQSENSNGKGNRNSNRDNRDNRDNKNNNGNSNNNKYKDQDNIKGRCYNCKERGHKSIHCPLKNNTKADKKEEHSVQNSVYRSIGAVDASSDEFGELEERTEKLQTQLMTMKDEMNLLKSSRRH